MLKPGGHIGLEAKNVPQPSAADLGLDWSIWPHLTSLIGSGIISFSGRAIHFYTTPTVEIDVLHSASQLFLANVLHNIIGVGRAKI